MIHGIERKLKYMWSLFYISKLHSNRSCSPVKRVVDLALGTPLRGNERLHSMGGAHPFPILTDKTTGIRSSYD
jgi:hypothetical protein